MGNAMNSKEESNDYGKPPVKKPVVKPVVEREVPLDPTFKKNLIEYLGGKKKFKNPSDKKVFLYHLFDEKPWLEINTPYDEFGNTALMVAIDKNYNDVIGLILHDKMSLKNELYPDKSPVDVTIKNLNNQTALMFASMKNDKVLAKKIFKLIPADKLKENLDDQDVNGNTALMLFVKNGVDSIPKEAIFLSIKDFINAGANINLKNNEGQTALDIAIQNNKPKFQEFLRAVSAPPQADGGCWSSKSYKSKRKGKKMDGSKKRSGKNRKSGNKKKSKKRN